MDGLTPEEIAANLTPAQREILIAGPRSFAEEHELPDGMFLVAEERDRDTMDVWMEWEPTDLCLAVRALVEKDG